MQPSCTVAEENIAHDQVTQLANGTELVGVMTPTNFSISCEPSTQGLLYNGNNTLPAIAILVLCFLLPFLHAWFIMFWSLGLRKGMSIIATYPTLLIIPTLTFLTFGPVTENWKIYKRGENRIRFSFRLTWVNTIFTLCASAVCLAITWDSVFFAFVVLTAGGLGIMQIVLGVLSKPSSSENSTHKSVLHVLH